MKVNIDCMVAVGLSEVEHNAAKHVTICFLNNCNEPVPVMLRPDEARQVAISLWQNADIAENQ